LASIADIAAKVENDQQETVGELAQAHGASTKTVHATLHKDPTEALQDVSQVVAQTEGQGNEKGAWEGLLMKIAPVLLPSWDNVLTFSESTGGEERAG
jgi:hypothetical protein